MTFLFYNKKEIYKWEIVEENTYSEEVRLQFGHGISLPVVSSREEVGGHPKLVCASTPGHSFH